ncbi:hypothetical protein ECE45_03690 [Helicobacter pylori]|nr:hypothetical protein ECE45_03690 [Helicobacter pylori]
MNGEFWRKGFIFNTNAFFAGKNHQTNSSFTCQYPFIIAYKSGVILSKITKACYNFVAPFCGFYIFFTFSILKFLRAFTKPLLKGWFNQLFKTNSFNTASH